MIRDGFDYRPLPTIVAVSIGTAMIVLAILALTGCEHPAPTLECETDEDCTYWTSFAPYCNEGICSQCAADEDCGPGYACTPASDGFGTCIGVWQ